MSIRAVIFDIGGVLVSESDWSPLMRWASTLGMSTDDLGARLGAVDTGGRATTGHLTEPEMRAGWSRELGLDADQTDAFVRDVWDLYCGVPDHAMIDFARSLRPAYRTGLLSNAVDGARREESSRYGFDTLTDDLVYSHEVHLAKPDPAIYLVACNRLGVEPGEAVFVDDRPENVDAAAELGMRAFLHADDTPATIAQVRALAP
ncbi:MAG TPA: HAD family phosphatase [Mycobacteriales bacterium]